MTSCRRDSSTWPAADDAVPRVDGEDGSYQDDGVDSSLMHGACQQQRQQMAAASERRVARGADVELRRGGSVLRG